MSYLRAFGLLLAIFVIGLCICLSPFGIYTACCGIAATVYPPARLYTYRLLIGVDQVIAVLMGRKNPDHTISGEVGYQAMQGSKTAQHMEKVIDFLAYVIAREHRHCRNAIEWDRVK